MLTRTTIQVKCLLFSPDLVPVSQGATSARKPFAVGEPFSMRGAVQRSVFVNGLGRRFVDLDLMEITTCGIALRPLGMLRQIRPKRGLDLGRLARLHG
jgi:hypothetical protein